jgi:hypothetical protein
LETFVTEFNATFSNSFKEILVSFFWGEFSHFFNLTKYDFDTYKGIFVEKNGPNLLIKKKENPHIFTTSSIDSQNIK